MEIDFRFPENCQVCVGTGWPAGRVPDTGVGGSNGKGVSVRVGIGGTVNVGVAYDSGFELAHDTYNGMGTGSDGRIYYVLSSEAFDAAGGVFVIEFLSVFIQDYIGIKLLKRRIFYRAPIHHTYQFLGIAEPKIVVRFWILAVIFTLVSLISIKLR